MFHNIIHGPNGILFMGHDNSPPTEIKLYPRRNRMAMSFFVMWESQPFNRHTSKVKLSSFLHREGGGNQ